MKMAVRGPNSPASTLQIQQQLLVEHLSLDLVAGDEVPLIDGVLLENPVVVRLPIHSNALPRNGRALLIM